MSRRAEQTHPWLIIDQRPDRWLGAPEAWVSQGTCVANKGVGFTSWTVLSPGLGGRAYRHVTLNQIFNKALTRG